MVKKIVGDLETDYRRWVRKNWKHWMTVIEYAVGGDEGNPDVVLGDPMEWGDKPNTRGISYWAELKIGTTDGVVVQSSDVRPSQVGWHRSAQEAGMRTCMLVGVPVVKTGVVVDWISYAVKAKHIPDWQRGYQISSDTYEAQAFNLTAFDTDFSTTLLGWLRSFA